MRSGWYMGLVTFRILLLEMKVQIQSRPHMKRDFDSPTAPNRPKPQTTTQLCVIGSLCWAKAPLLEYQRQSRCTSVHHWSSSQQWLTPRIAFIDFFHDHLKTQTMQLFSDDTFCSHLYCNKTSMIVLVVSLTGLPFSVCYNRCVFLKILAILY